MELTYSQVGDYLLPNLTVPDEHYNIAFKGIISSCKQVTQIVREHFVSIHPGTVSEFFHI